jgi:hypothetical protein
MAVIEIRSEVFDGTEWSGKKILVVDDEDCVASRVTDAVRCRISDGTAEVARMRSANQECLSRIAPSLASSRISACPALGHPLSKSCEETDLTGCCGDSGAFDDEHSKTVAARVFCRPLKPFERTTLLEAINVEQEGHVFDVPLRPVRNPVFLHDPQGMTGPPDCLMVRKSPPRRKGFLSTPLSG